MDWSRVWEITKKALLFLAKIGENMMRGMAPEAKRMGRSFLKAQGYKVEDE